MKFGGTLLRTRILDPRYYQAVNFITRKARLLEGKQPPQSIPHHEVHIGYDGGEVWEPQKRRRRNADPSIIRICQCLRACD